MKARNFSLQKMFARRDAIGRRIRSCLVRGDTFLIRVYSPRRIKPHATHSEERRQFEARHAVEAYPPARPRRRRMGPANQ